MRLGLPALGQGLKQQLARDGTPGRLEACRMHTLGALLPGAYPAPPTAENDSRPRSPV